MKIDNITSFTGYRDNKELEVLDKIHDIMERLETFDVEEMFRIQDSDSNISQKMNIENYRKLDAEYMALRNTAEYQKLYEEMKRELLNEFNSPTCQYETFE